MPFPNYLHLSLCIRDKYRNLEKKQSLLGLKVLWWDIKNIFCKDAFYIVIFHKEYDRYLYWLGIRVQINEEGEKYFSFTALAGG